MAKKARTTIRMGSKIASIYSPILLLIGIVLMILYWKRRTMFPLNGRITALPFIVAFESFLLCISFTIQGNTFAIPCAFALFFDSFALLGCTMVYIARSWRLLFRYKLQDIIQGIERLRMEGKHNTPETEKLLNSFYVRRRTWSTYKVMFKFMAIDMIFMLTLLALYSIFFTRLWSQPNNCNFLFREKSANVHALLYLMIFVHLPMMFVLACLLWSFAKDGFYIKQELRAMALSCLFIFPLYALDNFVTDEVSTGKWLVLALSTAFFVTAFLYPICLSYTENRVMSRRESEKKAEKSPKDLTMEQFVKLLNTDAGHTAMSKHLKKYFCSELVLFHRDAIKYQQEPTLNVMREIYEQYVGEDSIQEINLKASTAKKIHSQMDGDDEDSTMNVSTVIPDIYDVALQEVAILIKCNMHYTFRFSPDAWRQVSEEELKQTRMSTKSVSSPLKTVFSKISQKEKSKSDAFLIGSNRSSEGTVVKQCEI